MLLLFFFFPHNCATASDLRKRKTPSVRSSHLIRPGFLSGFSRMSLMNSHKCVPLWSGAGREGIYNMEYGNLHRENNIKTAFYATYCVFWPEQNDVWAFFHLKEKKRSIKVVLGSILVPWYLLVYVHIHIKKKHGTVALWIPHQG